MLLKLPCNRIPSSKIKNHAACTLDTNYVTSKITIGKTN